MRAPLAFFPLYRDDLTFLLSNGQVFGAHDTPFERAISKVEVSIFTEQGR